MSSKKATIPPMGHLAEQIKRLRARRLERTDACDVVVSKTNALTVKVVHVRHMDTGEIGIRLITRNSRTNEWKIERISDTRAVAEGAPIGRPVQGGVATFIAPEPGIVVDTHDKDDAQKPPGAFVSDFVLASLGYRRG